MKQLFILLILLSNIASAFSFDVWDSKITLKEAIQIAKENNIPLRKDGIATSGKNFNKSYLSLNKYPENRIFNYKTTLLNEYAIVSLYFTKESKHLYRIKVRWMKKDKEFIDTLYKLLDKKYGQKKVLLTSIGSFLLSKQRQWEEDENSLIQTHASLSGTTLLYIDTVESQKNDQENKKIIKEKKEKALIKDANKF
jgi:hypothetical protein